jgi:hypothetical protein
MQKMSPRWSTNYKNTRAAQPPNLRSVIPSLVQKSQPINTAQIPETPGPLTAEFVKLLRYNDALATPALKLLDLYVSLWECYVIRSAEKMRLEDEQRQLQELNEWLANDNDILLQLYDKQAMVLWDRKRAVQALCNGVVSALQASDPQACYVDGP